MSHTQSPRDVVGKDFSCLDPELFAGSEDLEEEVDASEDESTDADPAAVFDQDCLTVREFIETAIADEVFANADEALVNINSWYREHYGNPEAELGPSNLELRIHPDYLREYYAFLSDLNADAVAVDATADQVEQDAAESAGEDVLEDEPVFPADSHVSEDVQGLLPFLIVAREWNDVVQNKYRGRRINLEDAHVQSRDEAIKALSYEIFRVGYQRGISEERLLRDRNGEILTREQIDADQALFTNTWFYRAALHLTRSTEDPVQALTDHRWPSAEVSYETAQDQPAQINGFSDLLAQSAWEDTSVARQNLAICLATFGSSDGDIEACLRSVLAEEGIEPDSVPNRWFISKFKYLRRHTSAAQLVTAVNQMYLPRPQNKPASQVPAPIPHRVSSGSGSSREVTSSPTQTSVATSSESSPVAAADDEFDRFTDQELMDAFADTLSEEAFARVPLLELEAEVARRLREKALA